VLHRRRTELGADAREQRLARVAIVVVNAHLDELVRVEVDVDLVQHRGRQSVLADAYHRVQPMRAGAQIATLVRRQERHRS